MLYNIFLYSLCFFLCINCFAGCEIIDDKDSIKYGLNPGGVVAARQLLNKNIGDWKKLCQYSASDLTKLLNAFVYNYCEKPKSGESLNDINSLFSNCYTACGGRSYVLRGLLAVYGIKSSYRNIYNIQKQGNHSAVEVGFKDKLLFLDPTFGVFFTKKSINDIPLSLDEIIYFFNKTNLVKHVYQSIKISKYSMIFKLPINKIYSQHFDSSLMDIESYIEHENSEKLDAGKILFLTANITLKNDHYSVGCMNADSAESASLCFLKETNNLYSGTHANKYISYVFNTLGFLSNQFRINIFKLNDLNPDSIYRISLLINKSNSQPSVLHISPYLNRLLFAPNNKKIDLKKGLMIYQLLFKARYKNADFMLYLSPESHEIVNLYGFSIEKIQV